MKSASHPQPSKHKRRHPLRHGLTIAVSLLTITSAPLPASDSAQASAQTPTQAPDVTPLKIKPRPLPGIEPAVKEAIERQAKANRRSEALRGSGAAPMPSAECPHSPILARLKGVFIADRQYRSYAQVRTNRADHIYRLGDQLEDRVVIGIQWGDAGPRLVLKAKDRYECLNLRVRGQHMLPQTERPKATSEPTPQRGQAQGTVTTRAQRSDRGEAQYEVKELGPHRYEVSRASLAQLSPYEQVRLARVIPYYQRGRQVGFKIFGIRKSSFMRQIGFKNGDILRSINGAAFDSLKAVQAIWAQDPLRTFDHFTFDLVRRGAPISIKVMVK